MTPENPPPHRHISSTAISLDSASDILSTYLNNSELHPHLHPDALITPTGVTFSSHGGPTGGVVMHNLRRIAAGMRGEYLEPDATPEPEEEVNRDGGAWGKGSKGKRGKRQDLENSRENAGEENADGWQNMSEYEREEGVVGVDEVGDHSNFVASGGEPPEVQATTDGEAEEGGKKRKNDAEVDEPKLDKAARKKAKKQKDKAFRQAKEMQKKEDAKKAD